MKKRIITALILAVMAAVACAFPSFADGYEVIVEPKFKAAEFWCSDSPNEDGGYDYGYHGIFPTPFVYGHSVVHEDFNVLADMFAIYVAKKSYIVDTAGNKAEIGNYEAIGTYGFDLSYSERFGYEFNPYDPINEYGYINVTKNGKAGIIDVYGNEIVPCEYDDIYDAKIPKDESKKKTYEVKPYSGKYDNCPYYDPYDYNQQNAVDGRIEGTGYINGIAVVAENNSETAKVGIVDENDNIIVPFIYDQITPCYDEYSWVLKDGFWGIIKINTEKTSGTPLANTGEGTGEESEIPELSVTLNGEQIKFDQPPIIVNNRTMVPLRAIFEALGATVKWEAQTATVTSTRGDITISMTIGKAEMFKNGERKALDTEPQIVGGRTLVPVRAIGESFGVKVDWDAKTRTVILTED